MPDDMKTFLDGELAALMDQYTAEPLGATKAFVDYVDGKTSDPESRAFHVKCAINGLTLNQPPSDTVAMLEALADMIERELPYWRTRAETASVS